MKIGIKQKKGKTLGLLMGLLTLTACQSPLLGQQADIEQRKQPQAMAAPKTLAEQKVAQTQQNVLPADKSVAVVLGSWRLQSMPDADADARDYQHFYALFEPAKISGRAENQFFSALRLGKNSMAVNRRFVTTKRGSTPARMRAESIYFGRLLGANHWQINGDNLYVSGKNGELVFVRDDVKR